MAATPFTIHNLPYGVISTVDNATRRCATAFNDHAVDLSALHGEGVFSGIPGLEKDLFAAVGSWPTSVFPLLTYF